MSDGSNRLKKRVSFSIGENFNSSNSNTNNTNNNNTYTTNTNYNNVNNRIISKISPIDEQFISQIVLTPTPLEQPLSNVLKSIFPANRSESFMTTLSLWSSYKEEEIEKVCEEGYGLFVPTVETILGKVRETTTLIEAKVSSLREEISSSAQQIYDTRVERFEARKILLNVGRAIQAIEDCLKALNLLLMIQMEISDGHEHSAVKLIDEIQGKGALRAVEEMPFYPQLIKALEVSKKKVWDSATGQVKAWLSSVRDDSSVMGSLALSQLQTRFEQFQRQPSSLRPFELFLAEVAAEDAAIITSNDLVNVDFNPLQSSLRLFGMMDKRGELIDLLIDTRKIQLDLILSSRVSLERPDTDPKSLRSFLNSLTGFFVFERLLSRLPLAIYPLSHLETRWEVAQKRIREIALDSLRLSSSDRAAFMKIKWQLVFFTHTLEMFGFPKTQLVDTILSLFYRYVDLLRQDTIDKCSLAIENDNFGEVNSNFNSTLIIKLLPNLSQNSNQISQSLFDCVQIISTNFLQTFTVFLEGVPNCSNRTGDFAELSRRTVDDQILPTCAKKLLKKIEDINNNNNNNNNNNVTTTTTTNNNNNITTTNNSTNLQSSARLTKVLRTMNDFIKICSEDGDLTNLLFNQLETSTSAPPKLKLKSAQIFSEILSKAYGNVIQIINEKDVDRILDKIVYDRNPKSPLISPTLPIQDLILLLNSLNNNGNNTKNLSFSFFWIPIFSHIANYFDTRILFDVKYPHLSGLFFKNLAVDLEALDNFIMNLIKTDDHNSSDNDNYDKNDKLVNDKLISTIASLKEMCNLLQAESVHEYLDPIVRNRKYSHVQSDRIVKVLGKLKEPADKRKSIEDLILLLK